MSQPAYSEQELCPECGEFFDSLNEETGWCNSCSGVTPCQGCNEPLDERAITANEHLCNKCKYINWLEANADQIDRVMVTQQVTASIAKKIVIADNRPICVSCGNPIKGGSKASSNKPQSLFCTKTAKCRKAQNAYRYYYNFKRLTHEEALQRALVSATTFSLIEGLSGGESKTVQNRKTA